ncbi:BF3164 family lipoprotein [Roseivirga echinicomitans]|uniref:BF3164 family lipoprotein n=1 Tax=Roseivirga echinicomitans TaxID=296218 RepID=UPI0012FE1D6C|nr:BF3164 family lipoprotein [Roseivirga echinicomitans]
MNDSTDGVDVLVTTDSFPEVIDLSTVADSIEIPPVLLLTRAVASSNDLLVAHDVGSKDTLFRVFNSTNGKYLGGFGYTGPGPLDFEFQVVLPLSISMQGDTLQASDEKTHRAFLIDSKAALKEGKLKSTHVSLLDRVSFPKDLTPLSRAVLIGNTTLYGVKDAGVEKHLYAYNLESKEVEQLFDFPDFRPSVPATANGSLYMSDFALSTDGRKAVFVYRYFPVIRIYNFDKLDYTEINYASQNEQLKNIETYPDEGYIIDRDMYKYYGSVEITDERIYASYHEYQYVIENGERRTNWAKEYRELHVFDLSGKPLQKIILPKPFVRFTISPDDKLLYFTKPDIEDQLFYYKLK